MTSVSRGIAYPADVAMSLPRRALGVPGRDVAVGVGLAVVGAGQSVAETLEHRAASAAVSVLLGAGIALAGWSVWVPVVTTAVLLPVQTAAGVSLNDTFAPLFAVVLSSYLAASRVRGRERLAMLGLLMAAMPVAVVLDTRPVPGNLVYGALLVIAPALAGTGVATRQRYVEVLQDRTQLLEHQRATAAAAAAAAERLRIARELHDVVAHSLSVIGLQVGGVRRHLRNDQASERDALLAVEQTGRAALDDMHRMLGLLRGDAADTGSPLSPQPGLMRLEELTKAASGTGVEVTVNCDADLSDLPAAVDLTAYRIVQEALTNIRKHSSAHHVDVLVRRDAQALHLRVADDGDPCGDTEGTGLGLVGMRERVSVHGGRLTAAPRPDGRGFVVDATLPIDGTSWP